MEELLKKLYELRKRTYFYFPQGYCYQLGSNIELAGVYLGPEAKDRTFAIVRNTDNNETLDISIDCLSDGVKGMIENAVRIEIGRLDV